MDLDRLRIDHGLERAVGEWQRRNRVFAGFVRQPIELPGAVLRLCFGSINAVIAIPAVDA